MKQEFTFKQKVVLILVSIIGPVFIYLYGFTWRMKREGAEIEKKAREISGNVLFALWHSRVLMLCHVYRFKNIGIMVSKSYDGEWIGRIIKRLGYRIFRGSSSRGGATALHEMIKNSDRSDFALMVDGPRGPALKVKPGVVSLASQSGMPIVPITCKVSSAWRVKSWDRLIIPKPFSTVTVVYGDVIHVPESLDKNDVAEYVRRIEEKLTELS